MCGKGGKGRRGECGVKLTAENYFSREASEQYMSVSQFKQFMKCQAAALAEIRGEYVREKTQALMVGSYVDEALTGDLDRFKAENPEIFKKDGTLKAEYAQAEVMIARCRRDKLFMEFIGGQHQRIMTGVIAGVPVKIKVDCLHPDKIVDLKTTKDFGTVYDDFGRMSWFEAYNYPLQGAVYAEVVRQNIGRKLPFYLAAVTKEKTPDIDILHISEDEMERQLERFKELVVYFDAIKRGAVEPDRCEHCDYCKETKVLSEPSESGDLI